MMGLQANLRRGGGNQSRLAKNLALWWEMDEASAAARVDKVNGISLTNVLGATQVAGKVGNATQFNGTTQYLNDVGSGFFYADQVDATLCAWVQFVGAVPAANVEFLGKQSRIQMKISAVTAVVGFDYTYSGGLVSVLANLTQVVTANTWNFFAFSFNFNTNTVIVQSNADQRFWNPAGLMLDPGPTPGDFAVGANKGHSVFVPCIVDQVGFWKGRGLNSDELNYIYNSGAGRAYSEL